ncbi:Coiled-coil domain-containing protein 93 [Phytophthora nicotianae]|uniref:Coiled-coil domain-containing protein 93 n=1 Tax=Phytophthora nicotianae TaxID=4792 RepID=A0A0W8DQT2_PHYNI|nr:Coiled-coil domain-containing protein 93 [Phytophthora nicotianae]
MPARRTSRISTPALLTVALLALAGTGSVTDAAKCYPKPKNDALTPTVTDAPVVEDPSPATQGSFESNQETQGSSFPTETTTEAPAAQTGSYEETPTTESSGAQTPTESSFESSEVSQGSTTQTQASSDVSTGNSTSTSTGEHATFGDVTSTSGKCVIGNPNAGDVTREQVDWVWKNTMEEYIPQFKNLIFDQLITNKGKLSYCVRWDNDKPLEKAVASKFQAMLEKQINLWNRWLVGYQCWPIEKIEVSIVAYAVKDKSIMDWTDNSLGTIYEGILDAEGSPTNADTSACKGKPFDMSFWPSTKPGEGAIGTGGDWGQRVEVNDMLNTMDGEEMLVLLHEIGHGFGLPEMYVDKNKPADYPPCVMDNSPTLTDGDGWLLRSVLEHIKSRYDF